MDIDFIFKIAAIGILVSVLNQVLSRSGRDEQATMITLAGLVVVLMMVVTKIAGAFRPCQGSLSVMSEITRLVAVALVGTVFCVMIKEQRREIGLALSLTVGMLMLAISLTGMKTALENMQHLGELAGLSAGMLLPVVKTVGIGLLTHISAELCRDAGERSLAAIVEIGGSLSALLVALPLLSTVVTVITGLM